jgi:hypothetical protein
VNSRNGAEVRDCLLLGRTNIGLITQLGIAVVAQHVTSQGHVYLLDSLGRHASLHIPHFYSCVNYFFFGFGAGVLFELAVVRGVGAESDGGGFGACGVLCELLGCIASVSGNAGIFTQTDKPEKTRLSRRGWRGFCFHLVRLTFSSQQQECVKKTHGAACSIE